MPFIRCYFSILVATYLWGESSRTEPKQSGLLEFDVRTRQVERVRVGREQIQKTSLMAFALSSPFSALFANSNLTQNSGVFLLIIIQGPSLTLVRAWSIYPGHFASRFYRVVDEGSLEKDQCRFN